MPGGVVLLRLDQVGRFAEAGDPIDFAGQSHR
jgi:hypothetical protein